MFYYSQITDLAGILKNNNVTIDTSNCTRMSNYIYASKITKLGVVSLEAIAVRTRVPL